MDSASGFAARVSVAPPCPGDVAVELASVGFSYGGRTILDGVDLAFRAGEVAALVGSNGCGKSTTVKLMSRILGPSRGVVRLVGDDAAALSRKEVARRVSVLAQGTAVPSMQVEQLVMGGRYPYRPAFAGPSGRDRAIVRTAMERAGCARFAGADVSRLSGGERQRVYLAMVLAQDTPIVVMDEPTTYLDASACFDLMALARELADEGRAVVMVLHDLPLALSFCDRIAVMGQGRVQAFGAPDEVVASGAVERVLGVRPHAVELGPPAGRQWVLLPVGGSGGVGA